MIIKLVESLPPRLTAGIIGKQLIRCGTSVGANYRAAFRAKSPADFIAKMGIVLEEVDEANYWLELLVESNTIQPEKVADLLNETNQLISIVVACIKTAKNNIK